VKLTAYCHLVAMLKLLELYHNSPICLHGSHRDKFAFIPNLTHQARSFKIPGSLLYFLLNWYRIECKVLDSWFTYLIGNSRNRTRIELADKLFYVFSLHHFRFISLGSARNL
jgi:hypothetical protein